MRTAETREIRGQFFQVMPFGFTDQRRLFMRLLKLFGPGAVQILITAPSLASIGAKDVLSAAESLIMGLDDALLEDLAAQFGEASCTWRAGEDKRPYMDSSVRSRVFDGDLLLFFEWLLFCLEVNFRPFWRALAPQSGGAPAPATPQP